MAGGWDVRRGGAERCSGHFDTKTEAVDHGREINRNAGTEFRIHNRDGRTGRATATVTAPTTWVMRLRDGQVTIFIRKAAMATFRAWVNRRGIELVFEVDWEAPAGRWIQRTRNTEWIA